MCLESQHRHQRFCTPSFPDVKLAWTFHYRREAGRVTLRISFTAGTNIMAANLEKELIDKVRALPPSKQLVALQLLNTLAEVSNYESSADRKPIWEIVEEVNASLPA